LPLGYYSTHFALWNLHEVILLDCVLLGGELALFNGPDLADFLLEGLVLVADLVSGNLGGRHELLLHGRVRVAAQLFELLSDIAFVLHVLLN